MADLAAQGVEQGGGQAGNEGQQRTDVVGEFSVANSGLLQNMPGQNVEIKLRRDAQMSGVGKNRFDQKRMIEDGVARVRIAQEIDQGNAVSSESGKGCER